MRLTTAATAVALGLAGCATPAPLVDMTGVDPVVYQRDLDRCEAIAPSYDKVGPLVAGAIMGASFGMGVGAMAGGSASATAAEGYGAAAGAATGAGTAAALNDAPAASAPPPDETRSVADCLRAHGYKLLTPAQQ